MSDEFISWQSILVESDLVGLVSRPEQAIDVDSLNPEAKKRLRLAAGLAKSATGEVAIDEIGKILLNPDPSIDYFFIREYWEELKKEFHLLVCTKEKKYAALREELAKSTKKSQTAIVSSIAAAMAAQFGVFAGLLVPCCAMCLIVLLRIGKEAFCASSNWDAPLVPQKLEPKRRANFSFCW